MSIIEYPKGKGAWMVSVNLFTYISVDDKHGPSLLKSFLFLLKKFSSVYHMSDADFI